MSGAPVPIPVPVGELVAGKYRVERLLGHGGMGVVVAAMHEQLRQRVAIKMLLPGGKASSNALARFLREARAAAAIHGEHVARVLDVGELEGGAPFIVMEYLEGTDLAALLALRRSLPPDEAVGYLLEACEAIAEAHAAGIVHRDLKPSNLFLARRPDGTPMIKVLDFGISKALLAGAGETLTTTSSFVGSPAYSPPEQLLAAHDVDARADIWSLGTILYEALAGRTPFVGDSVMHVASRIFNESPTQLGDLRPDLPEGLRDAVMRCLRKKPEERFQDVRALADAIAPYCPSASISAERVARIVLASQPTASEPLVSPRSDRQAPSAPERAPAAAAPSRSHSGAASSVVAPRPSRGRGLVIAGVVVAGVVSGLVAFGRPARPPTVTSQATPGAAPVTAAAAPSTAPATSAVSAPPASAMAANPADATAPPEATASAAASAPPAGVAPRPAGTAHRNPLSVGVK